MAWDSESGHLPLCSGHWKHFIDAGIVASISSGVLSTFSCGRLIEFNLPKFDFVRPAQTMLAGTLSKLQLFFAAFLLPSGRHTRQLFLFDLIE